jgi:hypothetical protein
MSIVNFVRLLMYCSSQLLEYNMAAQAIEVLG